MQGIRRKSLRGRQFSCCNTKQCFLKYPTQPQALRRFQIWHQNRVCSPQSRAMCTMLGLVFWPNRTDIRNLHKIVTRAPKLGQLRWHVPSYRSLSCHVVEFTFLCPNLKRLAFFNMAYVKWLKSSLQSSETTLRDFLLSRALSYFSTFALLTFCQGAWLHYFCCLFCRGCEEYGGGFNILLTHIPDQQDPQNFTIAPDILFPSSFDIDTDMSYSLTGASTSTPFLEIVRCFSLFVRIEFEFVRYMHDIINQSARTLKLVMVLLWVRHLLISRFFCNRDRNFFMSNMLVC